MLQRTQGWVDQNLLVKGQSQACGEHLLEESIGRREENNDNNLEKNEIELFYTQTDNLSGTETLFWPIENPEKTLKI